jgi:circadian clock protein KaiC
MQSIGVDLEKYIKKGTLQIHATRPSLNGLELHLLKLHKLIKEYNPSTIVIDPISNLITVGSPHEVRSMLVRLIDMVKINNITAVFTSLSNQEIGNKPDLPEDSIASLVDTWIKVRDIEGVGETNRGIFIVKSRGMGHSNQIREFIITDDGIVLLDNELGPDGFLTGSARKSHEHNKKVTSLKMQNELDRKDRDILRKRKVLEANIAALRNEFESVEEELSILKATEKLNASQQITPMAAKKKKTKR